MKCSIYGVTFEIKQLPQAEFFNSLGEKDKTSDTVNMGRCLGFSQIILLAKEMKYDNKRITLIHELGHAIKDVLGYGSMNEENVMDFLAAHHDFIHNIVEKYFKKEKRR